MVPHREQQQVLYCYNFNKTPKFSYDDKPNELLTQKCKHKWRFKFKKYNIGFLQGINLILFLLSAIFCAIVTRECLICFCKASVLAS